jgi:hypothetical protein
MVRECTESEVDHLLKLKVDYTEAHMINLIYKVNTSDQVTQLLNRPEMTSYMADFLLTNPDYDHKIGDWKWLTEKQLLDTLNKTTDFDSLQRALNHENLSKSARIKWLKTLEKQHDKQDKNALKDPEQKIWHQLESLKILACKHAVIGRKEPAYAVAARTAFDLYQTLHKETTICFSQTKPSLKNYKENCKQAIEKAEPVLGKHRGYKQKLLDILNVILAYMTFSPPQKGTKWRFFEAKTASMQQVKKVEDKIDGVDHSSKPK